MTGHHCTGQHPMVTSLCAVLYEQGVDKEAKDGNDMTSVHWAAHYGHLPIVQYFEGLK